MKLIKKFKVYKIKHRYEDDCRLVLDFKPTYQELIQIIKEEFQVEDDEDVKDVLKSNNISVIEEDVLGI